MTATQNPAQSGAGAGETRTLTLIQAVTEAMREELARDDRVVVFGEDVGARGGVFLATADFAPIYPASEEVPSTRLRGLAERALPHVRDFADPLPAALKERVGLPGR